ncbi:MAG: ankyrin repeat domain-containing protein, partial [Planctomycetes bacterium]|nr:ankyrin repeat domain-containing protein [Planctomycetota bacterium]
VQEWVRRGNPVALKLLPPRRNRRNGPLRIALDKGFHSLVQVLLEAGAPIEEGDYHALYHAVELSRQDLVELLIQHGASVQDVSMQTVIATWDRKLVDLFVANGANLIDDNPIAWGLVNDIRVALGVFKQYVGEYPELRKQIDIALRYHADQGNAKWVALCLWAGADPWSRGPDEAPDWDAPVYDLDNDEEDEDEDYLPTFRTAVELAVLGGHREVLEQKKFLTAPDPSRPASMEFIEYIWWLRDSGIVQLLLVRGHKPTLYKDRCSCLITRLLSTLDRDIFESDRSGGGRRASRDVDSYRAQEQLKMIQLLISEGALWKPKDKDEIKRVRQTLIQMAPKYTYEFVQMVHDHQAASRRDLEELVRTPTMVQILKRRSRQIPALIAGLPEELPTGA